MTDDGARPAPLPRDPDPDTNADRATPRIVGATRVDGDDATDPEGTGSGAVWRLAEPTRGLDANVIALPAGDEIAEHDGPGLDVLIHVLDGSGLLTRGAEAEPLPIATGDLVWLPGDARRGYTAGPAGLRYFSVHARKPGMQIGRRPGL